MFERIRDALIELREVLDFAPDWAVALIILGVAATLALWLHSLIARLVRHFFGENSFARPLLTAIRGPSRLAFALLALGIAVPAAPLDPATSAVAARLLLLAVIGLIGWIAIAALNTAATLYLLRFRLDTEDNLLARKHFTQVRILLRTLDTLIVALTIAAGLMTFDAVRQYGVSLFASAGVAGLVVGLAARPVLSNLLAGVQLAVTQPIRIDDAVIVENEFGQIEEITSTYVVVKLWDLRRMIVPLTYFIEKPFQNWTREGAAVLGSAMLYLDHAAPIELIRQKAKEVVEKSPLWNGAVCGVQVTDVKQETIEVRVLVSSNNAGANFDLRCEVREKLIDFLAHEHPEALPRRRQQQIGPGVSGESSPAKAGSGESTPAKAGPGESTPGKMQDEADQATREPEDQSPRLSTARARRG
jgi:small-conductance mechanosensitive channel